MKRRSLILIILIVLLPVGLLTSLGLRMAKDEQSVTQQRFRSVMEQRLGDVNRSIATRFSETERQLHQITSLDDFDLPALREIVRAEPQVTQLFVLSPEGSLLYPNPADALNGTELSFLRQAARMFTDRDLQNAVALAEAGSKNDFAVNGPGPLNGMADLSSDDSLLVARLEDSVAASPDESYAVNELSTELSKQLVSRSAGPSKLSNVEKTESDARLPEMKTGESMLSTDGVGRALQTPAPAPAVAKAEAQPPSGRFKQDVSPEKADPFSSTEPEVPQFSALAPIEPPLKSAQQESSFLPSNGWFVWYWDRGLNLIYWQRRPSGHIVGAALERARWIADLIAWLPTTDATVSSRNTNLVETSFRVVSSSAEAVYEWGNDIPKDAMPFVESPLAAPLASWRLQCFVPASQTVTGGGRSAWLGFGAGMGAFALTLTALAWLLYRDYSRDMREASQQVSFVNQVSHELKTPLTNIRLYADLLGRDLEQVASDLSEKPLRRLEIITSEAQRLSRLIGNVLTFAKQHRKTLQVQTLKVEVAELIRQIAERFTPSLNNHGIEVTLKTESDESLWLDPDFVEQILGNLISNVEKYAAAGKQLLIRTSCISTGATVDVIDNGPGIPASQRSSVFVPFSRLSNDLRASSGTGIGLSITRELARLHGGDVTLQESVEGCWFQVQLRSQEPGNGKNSETTDS